MRHRHSTRRGPAAGQKQTFSSTFANIKNAPQHVRALVGIENKINQAYRSLESHTKKNCNMNAYTQETQNMMLLLAELRYLIGECKKAQKIEQNASRQEKQPSSKTRRSW
ncbi:MAG: hypothetical protein WC371_00475 [Parachlamydiales bacterium]|jgi:hypothetical protein